MGHNVSRGYVDEDGVSAQPGANGRFYFDGVLYLRERALKLKVVKALEILDSRANPLVQTASYSYHVSICSGGNVFRYCSPHDNENAAHHRYHHRHAYDPFGPEPEKDSVSCDGHPDWPTLSEVIEEAEGWFWDNRTALIRIGALKGP